METESSNKCSGFFLWTKKAFGYEIVLRGIQRCFLHGDGENVLFWNSTKAAKVLKAFQVHFLLYGQENYVFKRKFMKCINVSQTLYNFVIGAKEKWQNAPLFEVDFVLNFAITSRCHGSKISGWQQTEHVQSCCFANINLLLFSVLVAVAVVVA